MSTAALGEMDLHTDNYDGFGLDQTEIEARKELLSMLSLEQDSRRHPNQEAAAWRIRVKNQENIHSELRKLGTLALLSCGSMLCGYTNYVHLPNRHQGWKRTLHESPLLENFTNIHKGWITGASRQAWGRIEECIRNLGNCLVLAVSDLENEDLLKGFWSLKLQILQNCFRTDADTDKYVTYLKWLGKSCQSAFLNERAEIPDMAIRNEEGHILPFTGPLSHISDKINHYSRRETPLNFNEARQLVQIAQVPRGHCYPSKAQQITSIRETVEVITSTFKPAEPAVTRHIDGLAKAVKRLPKRPRTTHVSMNTSGRLEAPRSKGGGGPALVKATRHYTDKIIDFDELEPLIDRFDQFGEIIVSKLTFTFAKQMLKRLPFQRNPTIGDILYVKDYEIEKLWSAILAKESRTVPVKLGKILNLTASMAIREVGDFNKPHTMTCGIMSFSDREVRFKMARSNLPVAAGLSIEKGLKTRLTTSGMVAFAHLSQLPANYMRETLSQDPFLKTGLDEPDKLFQVLKAYAKAR